MPVVKFDPQSRLKWRVSDDAGDIVARFVFRDDAEQFARLLDRKEIKR